MVHLCLTITATECHIEGKSSYTFPLAKGNDSPVFYFELIPQRTGNLSIIITLHQKDNLLGSARVLTTAGEVRLNLTTGDGALPGLPPDLGERLRKTLTRSSHLATDADLHSLFADNRISPWRIHIPAASTIAARANALIDTLHDKKNTTGQNTLVLFLHVLAAHTPHEDAHHAELLALAAGLGHTLAERPNA